MFSCYNIHMIKYIERLTNTSQILIVGDIIVDAFYFCGSNKKSAEVNIPIAFLESQELRLGGASNVWNNIKGLNVNATLCGSIGRDKYGKFIKDNLKNSSILTQSKKTTTKHRYYVNNKQIFRLDDDYICNHGKQVYDNLLDKIKKLDIDAIIISDYLKGFCKEYFITNLMNLARKNKIFVAVDSKCKIISKYNGANLLKINKHEFQHIFNKQFSLDNLEDVRSFLIKNNIEKLLITLGEDGMVLVDNKNVIIANAKAIKNADVIGAGDCVISSYLVAHLNSFSDKDCLNFACQCAEYCVSKIGTKNFNINEYKKDFYEKTFN